MAHINQIDHSYSESTVRLKAAKILIGIKEIELDKRLSIESPTPWFVLLVLLGLLLICGTKANHPVDDIFVNKSRCRIY